MIAISKDYASNSIDWQTGFLRLLPEIQQRLQHAFPYRDANAREDATAKAIVECLLSFRRLHEQGRADQVTASNLAWYAAKRVRNGRGAGGRLNSKDPLAAHAQRRRGIRVGPLPVDDQSERTWIDALAHDRHATVLDHVAARLDIAAWLGTLCRRTRQIAADLAIGCTTAEVASKYRVSASRISQLRQELRYSWSKFQHEPVLAS